MHKRIICWAIIVGMTGSLCGGAAVTMRPRLPESSLQVVNTRPAFEVVAIKRPATDDGIRMGCHGADGAAPGVPLGRCVGTRITLRVLIAFAYTVTGSMISGGPDWANSEQFNFEAKAEDAGTTSEQFRFMFQALLADRFKLTFHREPREVSGYALTLAQGGAKLMPAQGQEGSQRTVNRNGDSQLFARKTSMTVFARYLSSRVGRPVVDETGLTGDFQFDLTWTPAEGEPNFSPRRSDQPAGMSIFSALPEQVGLRLVSRKISVNAFIIDHAEVPTIN